MGHGGLNAHSPPQRQPFTELGLYFCEIHTLGLNRAEYRHPNLAQIRHNGEAVAIGAIEDVSARVDCPGGGDAAPQYCAGSRWPVWAKNVSRNWGVRSRKTSKGTRSGP